MRHDFIAIGDTVTDAFITLKEARVDTDPDPEDHGLEEICLRFGDKIPYEHLTVVPGVGNSANAAVAAARLGLKTALITNIGKDTFGKDIIQMFKKEKLDTTFVTAHKNTPTNYHFVLSYKAERTILVKHQPYSYEFPTRLVAPRMLYLSSLGGNTDAYHDALTDWLAAHPETALAFQPGTYQMKMGHERLARLYQRTTLFSQTKRSINVFSRAIAPTKKNSCAA